MAGGLGVSPNKRGGEQYFVKGEMYIPPLLAPVGIEEKTEENDAWKQGK